MTLPIRARNVLRNLRNALPSGVVVGRRSAGRGPAEFIPLDEIAQANLDAITNTRGAILHRGLNSWTGLTGVRGDLLQRGVDEWEALTGVAHGSILYKDTDEWQALGPGSSGQFLRTNGAAADPSWAAAGGGGGGGMYAYENTFTDTSVTELDVNLPSSQEVMLVIDYIPTTDDDDLVARVTTDGFTTVESAADYSWVMTRGLDTSTALSTQQVNNDTEMHLDTFGSGNDTGEFVGKHVIVRGSNSTDRETTLDIQGTRITSSAALHHERGGARWKDTTVVDGLRFFMAGGGTFSEITVHTYSLVTS